MSVHTLSRVWAHSKSVGSQRLVLLAIADWANDDGEAYPAISSIAKKAAVSERTVQYCIRELAAAGELQIEEGNGRNHTHLYRVQILHPADTAPPQSTAERVQDTAEGVQPVAPKPSGEPLGEPSLLPQGGEGDTDHPLFKHWNSQPRLSKIRFVSPGRRKTLGRRLKEPEFAQNWEVAITRLNASDFATGNAGEQSTWKADIDWFFRPDSVVKIMEGKYDNRTPRREEARMGQNLRQPQIS